MIDDNSNLHKNLDPYNEPECHEIGGSRDM